jgi:hypothetical protein
MKGGKSNFYAALSKKDICFRPQCKKNEAARKKAKEEADRALYVDQLAKREKTVWKQAELFMRVT